VDLEAFGIEPKRMISSNIIKRNLLYVLPPDALKVCQPDASILQGAEIEGIEPSHFYNKQ
jgi:hypothetical protein